jgi:PAS domain S-box-containing protein
VNDKRTLTTAPSKTAVIVVSAALFAVILALKLVVTTPGWGFPLLYDIPVALLAIGLGVRGGLIGATVGMILYAIGDAAGDIHSNVAGYISRALTFYVLGVLLGLYAERLRTAEARVRESESHFRAAIQDSPVVVWQQDRDLRYTWIHNPRLGLDPADILGKTDAELDPGAVIGTVDDAKRQVLNSGRGTRVEAVYRNGAEPIYFDVTMNPLRDEDGRVVGLTGAATDVSELKRAQDALSESQAGLNRSQQMARLGSWEWNVATDEVFWSEEMHRLYGTSPETFEASYQAFLDRVHPDDRERVEKAIAHAYETGEIFEFDHRIVQPSGEVLTLRAHGEITLDEEGKPLAMAGTGQDVTAQRQAEEGERRLAAIVAQSEDAIIAKDRQGIINEWNVGAERLYGYPAEEALGSPISILIPSDNAEEERTVLSRVLEGYPVQRFETTRLRKDGRRVAVWVNTSPLRDANGEVIGASSVSRDVGPLKEAQQELERQNLELEQFAYVASHDLQEPLRSISGFVQLLERRYSGQLDEDADRFIGFVVGGVDRMQALIDDLLTYSRAGRADLQRQPVDSRDVVEGAVALLDAPIKESRAKIDLGELPVVVADRGTLRQVFQNLISNALKFNSNGSPSVEVSGTRSDEGVTFSVADNGIGISPDHSERIFRMFQRLHGRDEYGGTGIGLAICKRVVERHGGSIWCQPREGGGTVFQFTIPD